MNANEKIYVESYFAEVYEDDYENGEGDELRNSWSNRDVSVTGRYDTIKEALAAVLEANGYSCKGEWLNWGDEFGEDYGRFDYDVTVDADNCEATARELEMWKAGEKELYTCRLHVYLGVTAERGLTKEECNAA